MKNIKLIINNNIKREKEKFFIKKELQCILNLYAKMVSNGSWKDYSFSSGTREVTLTSAVTMKINLGATISGAPLGPTLNLLPEYAFAVHPTTTSEVIPNYPDPSGRRATTSE